MSRRLLALLALLVLAATAVAQEAPPHQREPLFPDDPRLAKSVDLAVVKQSLYDVCRQLTRETQVRITTDRALVDEPMMCALTERPARDVMREIAELFGYLWLRQGTKGEWRYILTQDARGRAAEEAARMAEEREVAQALRQELDRRLEALSLSPEQLQARLQAADQRLDTLLANGEERTETPDAIRSILADQIVRDAADPQRRVMLEMLGGLSPAHWDALLRLGALYFSTSPSEMELPLPADVARRLGEAEPTPPFPARLMGGSNPASLKLFEEQLQRSREEWRARTGIRLVLRMNTSVEEQPVGMLVALPVALGQERDRNFPNAGLFIMSAPRLLGEPEGDPAERAARLAMHPLLGKKAMLDLPQPAAERPGWVRVPAGQVLQAIAATYDVDLVSDAYTRTASVGLDAPSPQGREVALYEALDAFVSVSREWELVGDTIRIRSKTWAFDKHAEIPPRLIRSWLERLRQNGRLSIDEAAQIAVELRDEQISTLALAVMEQPSELLPEGFQSLFSMTGAVDMLRVYGRLLPAQRRQLIAGAPLPVAGMLPYQQRQVLMMEQPSRINIGAMFMAAPPHSPEAIRLAVLVVNASPTDDPAGPQSWNFELRFPDGQTRQSNVYFPPLPGWMPMRPGPPPGE